MKLYESIRLALRALAANKLRAILTMLGIIIGVGAVITLLSVGQGVQAYITQQFQSIGTNIFFVIPGSFQQELDKPAYLTLRDAQALADPAQAPDVLRVAPTVNGGSRVTVPGEEKNTEVNGVPPNYTTVRDWQPAIGSFFTPIDEESGARVAVLGKIVAEALFPNSPFPIGEIVRIDGVPFRVIGVMEERGGSGFRSEDDAVFVPLSTALSRLYPRRTNRGEPRLSLIYVQAVDEDRMDAAITEVSQILRLRHRIEPGEPDDFSIISQSDLIGTFEQITSVITVFLGAIAGISLLVGGIGIMNIMLASVTERTREIGIRRAIGAKRRQIIGQFLIETVVLSSIGGLIGIVLGLLIPRIISLATGMPTVVPAYGVVLSLCISLAVGIVFGLYPAKRAASLDPIVALRHE